MFNNTQADAAPLEKLWVLYDASCGFCVSCRHWLERQPAWVPLEFLPAGSAAAASLFPDLGGAREELTVVANDGSVYRAESAWLMCLWALREYRGLADRLSAPALLPLARHAFEIVGRNRKEISRTLHLMPEEQLRAELERIAPTCAKPPLPPENLSLDRGEGGGAARIVLAVVAAILLYILAGAFRVPISDWLLTRGIVRDARVLRVIGVDPAGSLRQAAERGDVPRIEMLVRAHADPSRRDATGRSPLFAAAIDGRRPAVEKLLALGADPLGPDPKGQPLPVGLVDAGRVEMLPLLHAPRSVWSHRDPNGRTVLLRAVERHDLDTVRAALGAGADPNDGGATDATPLARACDSGKLDLVDVLLKGGADPNAADARGDPPLVRLARYAPGQFAELTDRLMAAGADIDRKGAHGMTALIAASTHSDPRPVRVLLRRGADPTLTDDEGKTAYTHAQRRNPQVTEDLMEAARAIAVANPGERPTLETTRVSSDVTTTTKSTSRSARVPTPRR